MITFQEKLIQGRVSLTVKLFLNPFTYSSEIEEKTEKLQYANENINTDFVCQVFLAKENGHKLMYKIRA